MKRFISLLLAAVMLFSLTPAVMAEDSDVKIWGDNFESLAIGEIPYAHDDFYNSTAQKRPDDWTAITPYASVVHESDVIKNKVIQVENTTGETQNNIGLSKLMTVNEDGNTDFTLSFKVNPMGNNISVGFQRYGTGTSGTLNVISFTSGAVYVAGIYATEVEADKWSEVSIDFSKTNEEINVYIDNELVYFGPMDEMDSTKTVNVNIHFRASLAPGKKVMWDDFKIANYDPAAASGSVSNNLSQYAGVHPRLFYSADDFENLKVKANSEDFKEDFAAMKEKADKLIERGPIEYYVDTKNSEDGWMREVGNEIRFMSFVYKLTGEEKYKDAATAMVATGITYPTWGRGSSYENKNLACSHMLVGISCYYDWLYHDLDENEKYAARNIMLERGSIIAKGGWWSRSYLMNHLWNSTMGSYLPALALYDEYPELVKWAESGNKRYLNVFKYLGEDGACHEGMMYWRYGLEFFKYYLQLAKKFFNLDYTSHGYVQNTCKYGWAMILPETNKGDPFTVIPFSDYSATFGADTIENMIYLNTLCQDETIKKVNQWFINKYYNLFKPSQRALEYILAYYDKDAPAMSFQEANIPLETYFDELGLFYSRTKWQDNETVIAFRCGPACGPKAQIGVSNYDFGTGHIHNDINSPQIYTRGEHILAEDSYSGGDTASHNTLLVNNMGQIAEEGFIKVAPRGVDANPHITKMDISEDLVYVAADGTEIYDAEQTGLTKFVRHFIYLKPDMLIITDEVETTPKEGGTPVELRFFPIVQNASQGLDGSYSFSGTSVNSKIKPIIMAEGVKSEFATVAKVISDSSVANRNVVRILTNNQSLVQPTVISWSDKDKTPEDVTAELKDDGKYYFYTDNYIITLDLATQSVEKKFIDTELRIKRDGKLVANSKEAEHKDGRIFVSVNDIEEISDGALKAEFNAESEEITVSDSAKKLTMKIGSTNAKADSGEITDMDVAPYLSGSDAMVPIRFVGFNFGIDCRWQEEIKTLLLTTGVDFSEAKLTTLTVSGFPVDIKDGVYEYNVKIFGTEKVFNAVPSVSSAVYEVISCEGLFGENKVIVTSSDKTVKTEYTITTEGYTSVGNVPIYNMGYSTSDGNMGENVLDGDINTRWSASGDGQYLWYDLGKEIDIAAMLVAYASGDKRLGYFEIQVSDDGENWTTVKECTSSGATLEPEEYALDNVKTRFIRFYGRGAGATKGAGWNSVTEIGIKRK